MDGQEERTPIAPAADGDMPALGGFDRGWRRPAHQVRVCLLDSCRPMRGRELTEAIMERLGIELEERTEDGAIALEGLECIGLCGIAEAVLIDDEPVMGRDAVLHALDRLLDGSSASR